VKIDSASLKPVVDAINNLTTELAALRCQLALK
jgi:hypothetical protein